jgi:rRNA processing protein Gar1
MRRIGTVVRTPGGLAVVRLDEEHPEESALPAVGTDLVDEHLDAVGEVLEVVGPVARPYVVVSPAADRTGASFVGTTCYAR